MEGGGEEPGKQDKGDRGVCLGMKCDYMSVS